MSRDQIPLVAGGSTINFLADLFVNSNRMWRCVGAVGMRFAHSFAHLDLQGKMSANDRAFKFALFSIIDNSINNSSIT